MKTYRNLYPQICAWENIELAYRRARKGKRARKPAAAFEFDRERNLTELQQELRQKSYHPGPYHSFVIHEPKRRLISAAPFRDRVVHHALCNVIEPIFERRGLPLAATRLPTPSGECTITLPLVVRSRTRSRSPGRAPNRAA